MFKFTLVLEDGSPADPATLTVAVPNWREGDKVLIRPGFEFVIVAIDETSEPHVTWTVRAP